MTTQFYPATEDVAVIARTVRKLIKEVPGATFSVRINRQWANAKDEPKSIIYINGAIKLWGEAGTSDNYIRSRRLFDGLLKDTAEEYQLELKEYWKYNRYVLIQRL